MYLEKIEIVKEEMMRKNKDIMRNRELLWAGLGHFISNEHYVYYSGHSNYKKRKGKHL
jgi:hypothetical protein